MNKERLIIFCLEGIFALKVNSDLLYLTTDVLNRLVICNVRRTLSYNRRNTFITNREVWKIRFLGVSVKKSIQMWNWYQNEGIVFSSVVFKCMLQLLWNFGGVKKGQYVYKDKNFDVKDGWPQ